MVRSAPKLLLISRNLPPLIGGIERLIAQAIQGLAPRFDLEVWGPSGCREALPADVAVVEFPASASRFLASAWMRLASRRITASAVLAANGVVAPLAQAAARRAGCPYAVMVHGLDVAYRHPVYRWGFLPAVHRADRVVANSTFTAGLVRALPASRVAVVNPGVRWPAADVDAAAFRRRWGWGQRPVVLSVSRLIPRKGVAHFVEQVLPRLCRQQPEILYAVVGDEPRAAGRRQIGERERIEEAARRVGMSGHLQFLGDIVDSELNGDLGAAYAAADVFAFPLQDLPGDVEGFGMVALEAASFGLPSVAYAVGGVADAVVDGRTGFLIMPGDSAGFANRLVQVLSRGRSAYAEACAAHAAAQAWSRYADRLGSVLQDMILPAGAGGASR